MSSQLSNQNVDDTNIPNVNSVSAAQSSHPFLLFHTISETPGYQHRGSSPWAGWERSIISSADSWVSRDFSSRWSGDDVGTRGNAAMDLALAYQITGQSTYASKARQALLYLDLGDNSADYSKEAQLLDYSLAYDWTQPTLSSSDDSLIRDKLAKIANAAYISLNYDAPAVHTVDFQMKWYPIVGVAGLTLNDYTNPNHQSLSSSASDWIKAGTYYLFQDDWLHGYNRSLVGFQWDAVGKDFLGSYKSYYIGDFAWWCQIYSKYYGRSIFDDYPIAKDAFTSEVWESLPNFYSNNFVTNGNVVYDYHYAFANLMNSTDRSNALWHDDSVNLNLMPQSRDFISWTDFGPELLYLTFQDYSAVPRTAPAYTSHLNASSIYQVLRDNWNTDSGWLSLITWNASDWTLSNRNLAHHDQLSLEYYDKGDLLLADGGEDKYVLDMYYGEFDVSHNTVLIEDPRTPFATSSWSNSAARGMYKGDSGGVTTPSTVNNLVQAPWMEIVDASATIKNVLGSDWIGPQALSSSVQYERSILNPDKDYFIVVDRFEGTQPWIYRDLFRPTSLGTTQTTGTDPNFNVGHVNGNLYIGGTAYNWQSLPYKTETSTGITTNSLKWTTTSPYGKNVELQIYSVPSSQTLVTKHVTRIGGYSAPSEVYSPLVYYRAPASNNLYRATVLLSNYASLSAAAPASIPVTGNGNAMKVTNSSYVDYIYTGKGSSSFGSFSTDADTAFIRTQGQPTEYTMISGTNIAYSGSPLVTTSKPVSYLTLKQGPSDFSFSVKGSGTTSITVYKLDPSKSYQVTMDGKAFTNWVRSSGNDAITITTDLSEHSFKVIPGASGSPTPTPTVTPTPTPTATPTPTPTPKPSVTPTPTPTPTATPTPTPTPKPSVTPTPTPIPTPTPSPGVGKTYVSNYGGDTVSVIDQGTNTVTGTVQVGSGPFGVAYSPDGSLAYVAVESQNKVAVISTASNSVIGSIPTGRDPRGVAMSVDGTRLYVGNYGDDTISVINSADKNHYASVGTITGIKNPHQLWVSPDGTRLYVGAYLADTAYMINTTRDNGTVMATIPCSKPFFLSLDPTGNRLFVANYGGNNIKVYDAKSLSLLSTISTGSGPLSPIISPDGSRLYYVTDGDNKLTIAYASNYTVIKQVQCGSGVRGIAVNPAGTKIYVTNMNAGTVTVVNAVRDSGSVLATVNVGASPYGLGQFAGNYPSSAPASSMSAPGNNNLVGMMIMGWYSWFGDVVSKAI